MGDCAAKVNKQLYMPPLLWFSAPLQPENPRLMTLRAQHKYQLNAGKILHEKPIAWKNKELFQGGDYSVS